ncbi:DUF3307 domain-containing protein [Actinomadura mexicana]|uniref:DUF3307 domain-containing protein n=1 Tax=Actinomadura mexicana TaxID=134959 RepID=A0A238W3S4_9ACTN|nr:DUF3307 domain-containing protein [Actinomadura mexicana]SNR40369.1 Protein of unknown function [Actinomadura mexicana]
MSPDKIVTALTFVVVLVSMLIAHNVGDHWVQTKAQDRDKGLHGAHMWKGRLACLRHVVSYTVCTSLIVGMMWALFDLRISLFSFTLGQLVSAVTHYWADRRTTLERLAELVDKLQGLKGEDVGSFYRLGAPRDGKDDNTVLGTGRYALDQAWHWWWIFIASVVTAVAA